MLPNPLPSQFGPELPVGPTVIVATILFVAGSIRIDLPIVGTRHPHRRRRRKYALQRETDLDRRDHLEVVGSIRKSVVVSQSVTQTPFASTEMPL